jgi:drug/metabolite transporter (DMT)-like permease
LRTGFLAGFLFFVLSVLCFGGLDTIAKWLSRDYPILQITWARYFFALVVLLPWLPRYGLAAPFRSRHAPLQVLRAAMLATTTLTYFAVVHYMPLAEASSISAVSPLFLTALAALFLGEQVGWRRWSAIAVGFAGMLVIVRPGAGVMHWAASLALAHALMNAIYHLITRRLARIDPPATNFAYTSTVGALLFTLCLPTVWVTPGAVDLALMGATGVLGAVGHWGLIQAYRRVDASALAPYAYLSLPWLLILGWLCFGDWPDHWTLIGAVIVISSGIYVFLREAQLRREKAPVPSQPARRLPWW